ncbi:hypothetical protein T484DRAFT_1787510, partial [Baffinella frigidus]
MAFVALANFSRIPSPELLQALFTRVGELLPLLQPQQVANILWSLANLGISPPAPVMRALEDRAAATMHDFLPQNVVNTLWAIAVLAEDPATPLNNLMNTLWAIAVLAEDPATPWNNLLLKELAERTRTTMSVRLLSQKRAKPAPLDVMNYTQCAKPAPLDMMHYTQLHQFFLSLSLDRAPDARLPHERRVFLSLSLDRAPDARLPHEMVALRQTLGLACRDAFASISSAPSRLQEDVADTLRAMGLAVREEARDPLSVCEEARDTLSGYSIDILLPAPAPEALGDTDRPSAPGVAIEVDGPVHFLSDSRALKGRTLIKRRHLLALGYSLVAVPYWEWPASGTSGAEAAAEAVQDVEVEHVEVREEAMHAAAVGGEGGGKAAIAVEGGLGGK